jgi:hypothetical protein
MMIKINNIALQNRFGGYLSPQESAIISIINKRDEMTRNMYRRDLRAAMVMERMMHNPIHIPVFTVKQDIVPGKKQLGGHIKAKRAKGYGQTTVKHERDIKQLMLNFHEKLDNKTETRAYRAMQQLERLLAENAAPKTKHRVKRSHQREYWLVERYFSKLVDGSEFAMSGLSTSLKMNSAYIASTVNRIKRDRVRTYPNTYFELMAVDKQTKKVKYKTVHKIHKDAKQLELFQTIATDSANSDVRLAA